MPKRQVFYSFKYLEDVTRVQRIRNIGAIEDNKPVTSQKWEEVKKGGEAAIKEWIRDQMQYKSCVIVLIGENTWLSEYVKYEIEYAWSIDKPIFGIYIHDMRDLNGQKATMPLFTPFDVIDEPKTGRPLSAFVQVHTPGTLLQTADKSIQDNLETWVEAAIASPPQKKALQL